MEDKTMLKVENLSVNYGHIEALKNVSVDVKKGQICSIIGANGAGKSTLLKTISGLKRHIKSWRKGLYTCRKAERHFQVLQ